MPMAEALKKVILGPMSAFSPGHIGSVWIQSWQEH